MTALKALATGKYNGLGFILNETPFAAIELDQCVHQNQRIDYWAQKACRHFNSYTEYSPTGSGLHVLAQGDIPGGSLRYGHPELYSKDHYITLTLQHVIRNAYND